MISCFSETAELRGKGTKHLASCVLRRQLSHRSSGLGFGNGGESQMTTRQTRHFYLSIEWVRTYINCPSWVVKCIPRSSDRQNKDLDIRGNVSRLTNFGFLKAVESNERTVIATIMIFRTREIGSSKVVERILLCLLLCLRYWFILQFRTWGMQENPNQGTERVDFLVWQSFCQFPDLVKAARSLTFKRRSRRTCSCHQPSRTKSRCLN